MENKNTKSLLLENDEIIYEWIGNNRIHAISSHQGNYNSYCIRINDKFKSVELNEFIDYIEENYA